VIWQRRRKAQAHRLRGAPGLRVVDARKGVLTWGKVRSAGADEEGTCARTATKGGNAAAVGLRGSRGAAARRMLSWPPTCCTATTGASGLILDLFTREQGRCRGRREKAKRRISDASRCCCVSASKSRSGDLGRTGCERSAELRGDERGRRCGDATGAGAVAALPERAADERCSPHTTDTTP